MLTRRETLRGGTAAVAAIAVTGAVAAAVPAIAKSATSRDLPAAVDEPVITIANEMIRLETAGDTIDWRLGDVDGNADPTLDEADRTALRATGETYRDQWRALEEQLIATPARTIEGTFAKMRAWYTEKEQTAMLAGGVAWDAPPEEFAASIFRDLARLAGELPS